MSPKFRAVVRHTRTSFGWAWCATAEVHETDTRIIGGYADTWREGLAAAHESLAKLQAELMDEVHASRAARREQAPA